MSDEFIPDSRAERALLTRARRGDPDALRGMLHRYSSLIWSVCALASRDEPEAGERFIDAWDHILRSLRTAHRSPDIAGLLLSLCGVRLTQWSPEDLVRRAVTSAGQMARKGETLEAPAGAMRAVDEALAEHSTRLADETAQRHNRQRERALLPASVALAAVIGLSVAYHAVSRASPEDIVARALRAETVSGDLVTRLRDCASPAFAVTERDPVETRRYEEIGLVLEELSNMPTNVRSGQLGDLERRAGSLGLAEFALDEADRAPGDTRQDLLRIALVLEELSNL